MTPLTLLALAFERSIDSAEPASSSLLPDRAHSGGGSGCDCDRLSSGCSGDAAANASSPCRAACCGSAPAISVVIPSFARVHNVKRLLSALLQYPAMHRNGSEILVAHGSRASLGARTELEAATSAACENTGGCLQRVRHLDLIELNDEMWVAERFYAGTLANNQVVVHLDDDLLPSRELLDKLALAVIREPGFPNARKPGLYGPALRQCDGVGYADPLNAGTHPGPSRALRTDVVLTNVAATSKLVNTRFVESFNSSWKVRGRTDHQSCRTQLPPTRQSPA